TADEQARIQDAIDGLDHLLAPYSVTITEVPDPTTANVIIHVGLTSPAGTAAQGVLGCETETPDSTHDITILQSWNWYAGADPSAIGSDQYDFQTAITHELGHALGLGHNPDPTSTMYASLATGAVRRTVAVADLNIPDVDLGACALHAAAASESVSVQAPVAVPNPVMGTVTIPATSLVGSHPTGRHRPHRTPAGLVNHHHASSRHSVHIQAGHDDQSEHSLASAKTRGRMTSESVLGELALDLLQGRKRGSHGVS